MPSLGSRYADVGRAGLKGRRSSDAATEATARHPSCALASGCAAALALIVYVNSLPNGLVFDDETVIATNTAVRDPLAWRRIFLASSWSEGVNPTETYRPLTTWTFALDYAVHGDRPFGYHLVNVLGHAGVSALVVVFAQRFGLAVRTAALAGALFAVHPIHTEVVANAVGRAEILAAALALLALLARLTPGPIATAGAAVAYALALLAKEHTIVLLVLLPLVDFLFTDDRSLRLFARRLAGERGAFYAVLLGIAGGYLALRAVALGHVVGTLGEIAFWQNPLASVAVPTRVLTALQVQALALWLLIAPFRLCADYYYRHLPLVSSVAEPWALVGLLVATILAAAVVLVWQQRTTLFFLMTALLPYAVVSNLLFPIGTIFGERLLYLPSVGFCAIMAILLTRPTQRWARAVGGGIALALLLSWAGRTVLRNPVWHDNLVFAESTVRAAPGSAHAHNLLGKIYADMNRDREAIAEFNRALEIYPDDTDTLFNLGALRMRRGESTEALEAFHRVTELTPTRFAAWVDRAAIHNVQHEFGLAIDEAGRAIALRPEAPNGHVMRGYALLGLGRPAEARASFERALRLPRAQPDALLGYGSAALQEGDTLAAVRSFEHLVHVAPSAEAYRGLVASYRQAGRSADAARTAAVGHERFPGDPFLAP